MKWYIIGHLIAALAIVVICGLWARGLLLGY